MFLTPSSPKASQRSPSGIARMMTQRSEPRQGGHHFPSSKRISQDVEVEASGSTDLRQLVERVGLEADGGGMVVWAGRLVGKGVALCNAELVSYMGGVKPARMYVLWSCNTVISCLSVSWLSPGVDSHCSYLSLQRSRSRVLAKTATACCTEALPAPPGDPATGLREGGWRLLLQLLPAAALKDRAGHI